MPAPLIHGRREAWTGGQDQAAAVRQRQPLGKATRRLPLRFRGFVQLGDGRQVSGAWTPMLELPIWREEINEDDLRRLMRRPSAS